MARPKKYRQDKYIFQPAPTRVYRPGDVVEYEAVCAECRKPLTNKQIRHGNRYCSYKCSNRAKGKARVGTKQKRRFKHNLTSL